MLGPGVSSSHNLGEVDPLLLDAAAGNYRLAEGSPAIDAGDASLPGVQPLDLDGAPRVLGAATDIGAYESSAIFHDDFESGGTTAWSSAVGG